MSQKLSLQKLDVRNQKVLMRVDFNVPLDDKGAITDDTRIVETLPSLNYVLDHGGSLILMSHLGRPGGKKDKKFSLAPCAKRLSELLKKEVIMASDCIGNDVTKLCKELKPGQVVLLENMRFYEAEEEPEKDSSFVKELASLGTVYVNDAFGTAHRKHSSTYTLASYFPHKSAMGFLVEKELKFLQPLVSTPSHPFYAIIGGAKISSKLGVINSLLTKVDGLFLGGGMAYTFFKAMGKTIGTSLVEDKLLATSLDILENAKRRKIPIWLPKDVIIADKFSADASMKIAQTADGIPDGWMGMDLGPTSTAEWSYELKKAKTILWNGPVGVFEFPRFAKGTEAIAHILADLHATTIIGGGDSAAAVAQMHLEDKFTHVSTGGGASLEFVEFGHLPGIDALTDI